MRYEVHTFSFSSLVVFFFSARYRHNANTGIDVSPDSAEIMNQIVNFWIRRNNRKIFCSTSRAQSVVKKFRFFFYDIVFVLEIAFVKLFRSPLCLLCKMFYVLIPKLTKVYRHSVFY